MAVYLAITDGTTTVDLSAAYLDYVPEAAGYNDEWVSERGRFRFASGIAGWRTDIQNVGRLLTQAQEYQKSHNGNRVFIKFRWQGADDLYRSELAGGLVIPDRDALKRSQANATTPSLGIFEIEWTRRNWWEDDTERTLDVHGFNMTAGSVQIYNSYKVTDIAGTNIKVTSGGTAYTGTIASVPLEAWLYPPVVHYTLSGAKHGTFLPGTSAVAGGTAVGSSISSGSIDYVTGIWTLNFTGTPTGTITADFRYGYGNYLDVAATAIAGDLPAPVKLKLDWGLGGGTPPTVGTVQWKPTKLYFGAAHGNPVGFLNTYEWETPNLSLTGAASANALDSNGTHWAFTNLTSEYNTGNVVGFQIVGTTLAAAGNEIFVPLIRNYPVTTAGTAMFFNYNIRLADGITNSSEYIQPNTADGFIKLPPITFNGGNYQSSFMGGSVIYGLGFEGISGTIAALNIDFVQFVPTSAGYGQIGMSYNNSVTEFVIDGINQTCYADKDFGGTLVTYPAVLNYDYLVIFPNEAWRGYILGYPDNVDYTTMVIATYRPRKRVI
jgi:hypothetical protein